MFAKLGMLFGINEVINISLEGPVPVPINNFHKPIIVHDSNEEDEVESPNPDAHKLNCQRKLFSDNIGNNTCRALISTESHAATDMQLVNQNIKAVIWD